MFVPRPHHVPASRHVVSRSSIGKECHPNRAGRAPASGPSAGNMLPSSLTALPHGGQLPGRYPKMCVAPRSDSSRSPATCYQWPTHIIFVSCLFACYIEAGGEDKVPHVHSIRVLEGRICYRTRELESSRGCRLVWGVLGRSAQGWSLAQWFCTCWDLEARQGRGDLEVRCL